MLRHAYPGPGEPGPSCQAGKGKPNATLKGMAGGCCRHRELLRNLYIMSLLSQDLRAEVKPLLQVI